MKPFKKIKPDDVIEVRITKVREGYEIIVTVNKLIISQATTLYFTSIKHYLFGVFEGIEKNLVEEE